MAPVQILDYIKNFADQAHGQQVRKYTGERYIVHPVRVMQTTSEYSSDIRVHCAALLHDVLEDTEVTVEDMESALGTVMNRADTDYVIKLVIELTDIFVKENYPKLNRRIRKEKEAGRLSNVSADAQFIKYADIIDNVQDIVKEDIDFARVYVMEAKKLLMMMQTGNPVLRDRAIKLVDDCLERLKTPQLCR